MVRLRLFCCLVPLLCARALAADAPTLDTAVNHLYNFNFRATHEVLDRLIAHSETPHQAAGRLIARAAGLADAGAGR